MKKLHLVILALIIGGLSIIMASSDEFNSYKSFEDATKSGRKVRIVGQLARDKEMYYKPTENPNYFTFYIKDEHGEEKKVVYLKEKPKDIEMSEKIVLTGKMRGGEFYATDILLKCPSKYKDEELKLKS